MLLIMESEADSKKQIVKSSSIIGGASVISIMIGLIRVKVLAVMLGASGVGLMSLFNLLMSSGSKVSALGIENVGTRQIAKSIGEDQSVILTARRALLYGASLLSIIGGVVFWFLREPLALWAFNDVSQKENVGWLSLGVFFTVASTSQLALLRGLRDVKSIAKITIASAIFSTTVGVGAIILNGEDGLILFVLVGPVISFFVGHWYVSKHSVSINQKISISSLVTQWKVFFKLGIPIMLSGAAVTLGYLQIRVIIQQELGIEMLGQFQAAWALAGIYLGFIFSAMGTDFYPRLVAVANEKAKATKLVNEQCEVAIILSGPLLIIMMGFAPWIIELLYSAEFVSSASVLRWLVLGNVFKILCWPLSIVFHALGYGRLFLISELVTISFFILLTWVGLPIAGIESVGIGFLAMYILNLIFVYTFAYKKIQFRWQKKVMLRFLVILFLLAFVLIISWFSVVLSAIFALFIGVTVGLQSLVLLEGIVRLPSPVARVACISRKYLFKDKEV